MGGGGGVLLKADLFFVILADFLEAFRCLRALDVMVSGARANGTSFGDNSGSFPDTPIINSLSKRIIDTSVGSWPRGDPPNGLEVSVPVTCSTTDTTRPESLPAMWR